MQQTDAIEIFETTFEGDHWAWKALEDFVSYKCVYEYVTNSSAVDAHKDSIIAFQAGPDSSDDDIERLKASYIEDLKKSLNHIAAQNLVSLCTTFEVASRNFFCSLFVKHPRRMHDFIGGEGQKGRVEFARIVNAEGYLELILDLARVAASRASKGDYSKILERAAQLCRGRVDQELLGKMDQLQSERNKIVHEKYSCPWEFDDVSKAQDTVASCIATFCSLAVAANVPGSYTFIETEINLEVSSMVALNARSFSSRATQSVDGPKDNDN